MSTTAQPTTLLRVRQVADRLGVSIPTVRRWIAAGDLEALRLGRPGSSLRITEGALLRFISRTGAGTA